MKIIFKLHISERISSLRPILSLLIQMLQTIPSDWERVIYQQKYFKYACLINFFLFWFRQLRCLIFFCPPLRSDCRSVFVGNIYFFVSYWRFVTCYFYNSFVFHSVDMLNPQAFLFHTPLHFCLPPFLAVFPAIPRQIFISVFSCSHTVFHVSVQVSVVHIMIGPSTSSLHLTGWCCNAFCIRCRYYSIM